MTEVEFPAFLSSNIPIWWNRERLCFVVYDVTSAEVGSFHSLDEARKCWEDYCIWLSKED